VCLYFQDSCYEFLDSLDQIDLKVLRRTLIVSADAEECK
jgi:hypothetical protein